MGAHYSSDSALFYEPVYLDCTVLERNVLHYVMHGPGRSNLPGISLDSVQSLADRLRVPSRELSDALDRMCTDPKLLRIDRDRHLLASALACRLDPYRGIKCLTGWYKNWCHFPESPLKVDHIEHLVPKVDKTKIAQVDLWNRTFGAVERGRFRLAANPDPQQELPMPPTARVPREEESGETTLPHRSGIDRMYAKQYVELYAPDLLAQGVVQAMGASAEIFQSAMVALENRAPGHKTAREWDITACNFIDTELFIHRRGGPRNATPGTSRKRSARPARAANGAAPAHDREGSWGQVVRRKAARTAAPADT